MKYFLIFLFSFSIHLNAQDKFSNLDVFKLQYVQDPQEIINNSMISRSIASCEGALLDVDASQGNQDQTNSNI